METHLEKLKKIAVVDIDGVLNYYPQIQINFFNDTLHTNYKTLKEAKESLSYTNYKKMKALYRCSEYKHAATVRDKAKELLENLRKNGYLIYLVTSRQLFQENMLQNTILWLNKNNLIYDYIYCTIKKDFTIFEKFGHVDIVIEDNCDNINKISEVNGHANYFLVNNDENKEQYTNLKIHRINNLTEIEDELWNISLKEYK